MQGLESTLGARGEKELREAIPDGTDLVARLARTGVEARLFGGSPHPIQVGRYMIAHELGTGGMGVVYRAHDPELARDVALKLLHPTAVFVRDPEVARGRLVREARAMAKLSHPNVLAVHEVGTFEDQVYVAMEFVEGRTLAQWLTTQTRTHDEILDVFMDAGRGLAAAHDEGIVHRDFKPENVMVSDKGRVHVLDFGLARGVHERAADTVSDPNLGALPASAEDLPDTLTQTGALVGTPAYMSPEQYAGLGASERSDQFSFCVALWESLYAARPFAGNTVASLAAAVTRGEIEDIPSGSSCPAWVRNVLARGLSVDPDARYPSMHELLDALASGRRRAASLRRTLGLAAMSVVLVLAGAVTAIAVARQDMPAPIEEVVAEPPSAGERRGDQAQERAPVPIDELSSSSSGGELPGDDTAQDSDALALLDEPQDPPASSSSSRSRTRMMPTYAHAYCYYEEDSYRDLTPQEGRNKFHKQIHAKGKCWNCELRKDTQHVRIRVALQDCRRYAQCRQVDCASR